MKLAINKSILIAAGLALATILWMVSGLFKTDEQVTPSSVLSKDVEKHIHVQITSQSAQPRPDVVTLYGQTTADRDVQIKAETKGRISEVLIDKGQPVKKSDVIARLAIDDRQRRLSSAQALVRQRQLEFNANKTLSQKSFRSQTTLAEAEALLNAARADLESARLDMEHTAITAPFDGYLEERTVEIGDYVDVGDIAARVLDTTPLVITIQVPEGDISQIQDGQTAQVRLSGQNIHSGIVRYVARSSTDQTTRTYPVEIEIENPNGRIPAGLTAEVRLEINTRDAYLISPSVLTLAENGAIGVKIVNNDDRVEFHPVEILEDTTSGMWVSGLPQTARLISRGQEYVSVGQHVITQEKGGE